MSDKVTEFVAPYGTLPHIPDDVTLPQFILDSWHPTRPVNKNANPVLIEDSTGRGVHLSEVSRYAFNLRVAVSHPLWQGARQNFRSCQ